MKYILFLDDVRHPMDVIDGKELQRYHSDDYIVVWAKNLEQAKWYVENYGLPAYMHLDHDLGYGIKDNHISSMITTMDFLNWLRDDTEYCSEFPPGFVVHSENPEGRKNIQAFMMSWAKSCSVYVPFCDSCDDNGCNNCTKATEDT